MPAHEITLTRDIPASPDAVWAVLSDVPRAADFLTGVDHIEMLSAPPYGVGTRWRETRTMMGRQETQELWVDVAEAPHRTVVKAHAKDVAYTTAFVLEPVALGPGGTRLTLTFSAQAERLGLSQRITWTLFGRMGVRMASKAMAHDLADIAAEVARRAER